MRQEGCKKGSSSNPEQRGLCLTKDMANYCGSGTSPSLTPTVTWSLTALAICACSFVGAIWRRLLREESQRTNELTGTGLATPQSITTRSDWQFDSGAAPLLLPKLERSL